MHQLCIKIWSKTLYITSRQSSRVYPITSFVFHFDVIDFPLNKNPGPDISLFSRIISPLHHLQSALIRRDMKRCKSGIDGNFALLFHRLDVTCFVKSERSTYVSILPRLAHRRKKLEEMRSAFHFHGRSLRHFFSSSMLRCEIVIALGILKCDWFSISWEKYS